MPALLAPLAMLGLSAAAPVVSSFLGNLLGGGPSREEEALQQAAVERNQAETAITRQRQQLINDLIGRAEGAGAPIVGPRGNQLIFRLPGQGGGDVNTQRQLRRWMEAIDFGDKREFDSLMQVLGQATSGNSSAVGEALRSDLSGQRAESAAGFGGLAQDIFDQVLAGIGPGGDESGLSDVGSALEGILQGPGGTISEGIAPIDIGSILDVSELAPPPSGPTNILGGF